MSVRQKNILFVDDDVQFLAGIKELFSEMSGGTWTISTGQNHSQALEVLNGRRFDLVVLDIGMPVLDGMQFLRLLARTNPGQQVVILTGLATPENSKACLDGGAMLVLEKPANREGFSAVFSTLDALAGALPQEGFQGLMRRVGLHEVMQLECLGRKSSVLEIFTSKSRGRIYIRDGGIVHAECGTLDGEVALYGLLAWRGGQFNLLPYVEPAKQTISGNWEMLLMEAARLNDEKVHNAEPAAPPPTAEASPAPAIEPPQEFAPAEPQPDGGVRIEEVLLCSGSGEVLYQWECPLPETRLRLIEQLEQQALDLGNLVPVGRFNRLEILTADDRIVCQAEGHRRLWVRSTHAKSQTA
jgi:CheY-like chemotaxis protein